MKKPLLLVTKTLSHAQRELLLNTGMRFVSYDAIQIEPLAFEIPANIRQVIFTSQHAVQQVYDKLGAVAEAGWECFVVGEKTAALATRYGFTVQATAKHGKGLADILCKKYPKAVFTYFCSAIRRDELPDQLKAEGMTLQEIPVYDTLENKQHFDQDFDAILFFSPSGVSAFAKANACTAHAICIGPTTAESAQIHFEQVSIANTTSVESVIAKAAGVFRHLKSKNP